jgi:hypothetical protein
MAIGFHQGQSSVSAAVQPDHVTGSRSADQLLDFTATGTSPPLPGASLTMGAGAALIDPTIITGQKQLVPRCHGPATAAVGRNLLTFFAKQVDRPADEIPDNPF